MSDQASVETPAPAPKVSRSSKLVAIAMIVNTLLVVGALVFVKQGRVSALAPAAAASPATGEDDETGPSQGRPGPMVKLDPFVIQLASVDPERYLRVAFDLELRREEDKDAVDERMSRLRDSIISYFSDRTLDELRGSEGMNQVKRVLLERLAALLPGRALEAIYITDFLIQ